MALFQGKNGGVPFPRNVTEWMEKGLSPEAAQHKLRADVFGHDYKVDGKGNPIETGIGSALNSTPQHQESLEKAAGARAAMRSKIGYSSAVAGAFDPRAQAMIDELQAKIEQLTRLATRKAAPRKARKVKPTHAKVAPAPAAEVAGTFDPRTGN